MLGDAKDVHPRVGRWEDPPGREAPGRALFFGKNRIPAVRRGVYTFWMKPAGIVGGILAAFAIGWALSRTLSPDADEPPSERPARPSRSGPDRASRPADAPEGTAPAVPETSGPVGEAADPAKGGKAPPAPSGKAEPEAPTGEFSPKMLAYMSKMLDARERLKQKPETYAEMGTRLGLTEGQLRQVQYLVGRESEEASGEVGKAIEGRGYKSLGGLEAMNEERRWEEFQVIGKAVQRARERYDASYRELGLTDKQLALLQETRQQFTIEGDEESIRIGVTRLVQE